MSGPDGGRWPHLDGTELFGPGGRRRSSGGPRGQEPPQQPVVEEVDYEQVRVVQQRVAERLARRLRDQPVADELARRQLARHLIAEELSRWADEQLVAGRPAPSRAAEQAMAEAVDAALYGLGRLQPLVDDQGIENIEINGCAQVWLAYADGRIERGPAVADSDGELLTLLQRLAAQQGRALSTADPRLHLSLPGGSRLAAMVPPLVPRPQVVIRRHRATDVDLDDLIALGTIDRGLADFLRALMAARKNIIVSGRQNAGKTTLIRALAHEIPPLERFATVEKEYELFLHESDSHPRVMAMQAREGGTEYAPDGRPVGEITLPQLVEDALRMNLQRIIVGEVRGSEVFPMFRAMTHGEGGSLCTVHARSARTALETLVTLCLSASTAMSDTFAYRLAANAIDFIVHIRLIDETSYDGGELHRFVSEVYEVTGVGEGGRPAINSIFKPGPDGRAIPRTNPACLDDLRRAGLGMDVLSRANGSWSRPLETLFDPR